MEFEEINTITVLGAGVMGHGIAEAAAIAKYDVRLRDLSVERVGDGFERVEWSVEKLVDDGHLTEESAEDALDRITPLVDLAVALEDTDLVIEAVPERVAVKREVYRECGALAPESALLVTNTSTFSITDLAAATDRPGRFCGMHFFNPPVRMPLVEIVAGAETDAWTLKTVESVAESIGKTPIRVREDAPGFIVNRVLVPMINDAAWQVHDELATIDEIDCTAKHHLGLPMGCFELADQIGIDVVVDVLSHLHERLGDDYEPAPPLVEKAHVGDLGKKSGMGFYDHFPRGPEIPTDRYREDAAERLVAVAANEAGKLVSIDAATIDEIDEALRLGARFPSGPTELAAEFGFERLRDRMADVVTVDGPRYEPTPGLEHLMERRSVGEKR